MSRVWVRIIEVAALLMLVGGATAIAIPKAADLRRRDTASLLLADVETVRSAVYAFYSDSAYFPADSASDFIPENLRPYLPVGFSFVRTYGSLEYRNWPLHRIADTTAVADSSTIPLQRIVGVLVSVKDPKVGAKAAASAPLVPRLSVGNKYAFLIFGT